MKFTLSFADFSAAVAAAGYTPVAQTDKVFVVKPKAKGAGKVEINLSSGTFYVGAGSRHVEALGTAVADYYKPIKQTKGWTVFMVPLATGTYTVTDGKLIMRHFMEIVQLVEQATPKATGKAPKAPKAKATVADKVMKAVARVSKPQTAEQIMRAAEIKARNLATMKAVTAKLNQEAA